MTIYKIRRRNGSIVTFEKDKIANAIQSAFEAVGNKEVEHIPSLVDLVISNVENKVWNEIPDVEMVQDIVESVLIQQQFEDVAKAYILYREKRVYCEKNGEIVEECDHQFHIYS